jgi:hypothetical protein
MLAMPPRAPLTGSFSVNEENNVVVCPLRNHDGSACRKRCTGVSLPSRPALHPARHARSMSKVGSKLTQRCTGKAISLHAGAHPPRTSRALHLEAPSHRGELHADDKHATAGTTSASPPQQLSRTTRLVPTPLRQHRGLTRLASVCGKRLRCLRRGRLQHERAGRHRCSCPGLVTQLPRRVRLGF